MPIDPSEQTPQLKSLYTMGAGEIMWRNFLAGFMHGLGGLFVTLISWGIILYVITVYVFPQVSQYLDQAERYMSTLERISQPLTPTQPSGSTQPTIQIPSDLFEQLQQVQGR